MCLNPFGKKRFHRINRLTSRVFGFKCPVRTLSSFYLNQKITNSLVCRIFGCVSFVHVLDQRRRKLDPRALNCLFVVCFQLRKGMCYHPLSMKFYVSMNVTFNEQEFYFTTPNL